jgi:hypothetical protein
MSMAISPAAGVGFGTSTKAGGAPADLILKARMILTSWILPNAKAGNPPVSMRFDWLGAPERAMAHTAAAWSVGLDRGFAFELSGLRKKHVND